MTRRLAEGFLSLFGARVAISVLGTLSLPVVVRVLGPEHYGDYAFLLSVFSMMMLLVSPAVTEGVQKFVAERRELAHWEERVAGFYLRLSLLLAIPGSLLLAVLTWQGVFADLFGPGFDVLFYILAIHVVTAQLSSFSRHTLLGLELERYSEALSVVRRAVSLGVGIGLALFGFGVAGFLVGHVAAAVFFTLASVLVFRRKLALSETLELDLDALPARTFVAFNGLNVVLVILMQSLFHTDVMMVRFFEGGAATGYYKAALVLAEYLWMVPIALQQLMIHSASQLWAEERLDRIQELASSLTRYVFLVAALLALGIGVLADSFVPIYYGAEFGAAVLPLLVLLPGAVGFALARPLYGVNQAAGRLKPLVLVLAVPAGSNLALNSLLIPEYGIAGAAAATSLSYGSMFLLQAVCARYLGYSPLSALRPLRLLGTVAVSGPVIYGVDHALGSDLLSLLLVPPTGFAVFATAAVATGAVTTAEVQQSTRMLPPVVGNRVRSVIFRT